MNLRETLGGGILVGLIGVGAYLFQEPSQRIFIKKDLSISDTLITADNVRFLYEANEDSTKRTIRIQFYRNLEPKPYITKELYPIGDFTDVSLKPGLQTLKITQLGRQPIIKKEYHINKLKEIK